MARGKKGGKPSDGGGDGGGTDPVVDLTVIGTSGSDRLGGGAGNDTFTGLEGDDKINGGDGFDTAVYRGSIHDFSWSFDRKNNAIVTDLNSADGNEGRDTLTKVEAIQFDDYTYLLYDDNPAYFYQAPVSTTVDTPVYVTIEYYDLDDRSVYASFTFNPNTQGWITNIEHIVEDVASGRKRTSTFEFDPTTVDRSYLAEGEVEVVTFDINLGVAVADGIDPKMEIQVIGLNDAPTMLDDAEIQVTEDAGAVQFDLATLGQDVDSDDDGSSLSYAIVSAPDGVAVSLDGTVVTVDPGAGFQLMNSGETLELTLQVQAMDQHGAVSEVQDVIIVVNGADDPVPTYLDANGRVDYGLLGLDPSTAPVLPELNGLTNDPSYPDIVAFTDGDDAKIINTHYIEGFSWNDFWYSGFENPNYDDLAFYTGLGNDKLVFLFDDATGHMEIVDIAMGAGEDVLVIDSDTTGGATISGLNVDMGDDNDQLFVEMDGPGVLQFGLSEFNMGEGNDLMQVKITNPTPDGYGALGALISTDIWMGDGNDTLLIDLRVDNPILWDEMGLDIDTGHGNDHVEITTGPGEALDGTGIDGEIDLGTGDDYLLLDLDADASAQSFFVQGGWPYHLGPEGGYDIVELADGDLSDYSLTAGSTNSYTLTYGNQTVHFSNVEEILLDGENLIGLLA
ncbi:Ig-like domain-containing protein [Actibacterium pelagium]|uniref:Cadherin domain-containing protein n=1 Tax=Actibacterium pelagium TaxID=2029103 RepID=A0A917AHG2_9RHOB|nr:hypothetical protein [Actibacterium pelagium]GGE53551.1 hypothetical protein GCM10011517_21590 [Actibacterium pelagium]